MRSHPVKFFAHSKTAVFFFIFLALSCQPVQKIQSDRSQRISEVLSRIQAPVFPERRFSVMAFGALPDSPADSKPAFDKAIAECAASGGGIVVVPTGIYQLNGPIHLESNINLRLEEGSVLKFSSEPSDYLPVVRSSWEGTLLYNYSPFIYAYQKENIAITGTGTIDGEASETWQLWRDKQLESQLLSREMNHKGVPVEERIFGEGHFLRPHLVQLFDCKNILVEDVTIEDSPFWCVHLLMCKNVTVRGVKYDAQNKNNDGVDPEYSEDVLIENVRFNNNDDNVAVKAGRDHEGRSMKNGSRNIVVRNCSFMGLHALVIGSEMSAGVSNVFVENCNYGGYVKRGIYLKSNADRGGEISHIYVDNLSFGETDNCFQITSTYKNEGEGYPTDIHDVYLSNVSCEKANEYGVFIQGSAEKKANAVYLENITIDSAATPAFIENAENIRMENVRINGQEFKR